MSCIKAAAAWSGPCDAASRALCLSEGFQWGLPAARQVRASFPKRYNFALRARTGWSSQETIRAKMHQRSSDLHAWLSECAFSSSIMESTLAQEFFEVSPHSWPRSEDGSDAAGGAGLQEKPKEGYLVKRSGKFNDNMLQIPSNKRRWFILRKDCLVYYRNRTSPQPQGVLMFDSSLDIKYGLRSTVTPSEFVVCNRSRELVLRAATTRDAEDWIAAIKKKARESAFCARNRFLSFAPHRTSSLCSSSVTWLLNGQPYFDAVEDALILGARDTNRGVVHHTYDSSAQEAARRDPPRACSCRLEKFLCSSIMKLLPRCQITCACKGLPKPCTRTSMSCAMAVPPNLACLASGRTTRSSSFAIVASPLLGAATSALAVEMMSTIELRMQSRKFGKERTITIRAYGKRTMFMRWTLIYWIVERTLECHGETSHFA